MTKAENEQQEKEEREEREAQKKLEEIQRQQKEILEFEMKIQQLKLETVAKHVQGDQPQPHVQTSKLPKMEIKQFSGNKIDWPRFWSQFVKTVKSQSWQLKSYHIYMPI